MLRLNVNKNEKKKWKNVKENVMPRESVK